jgi:hypothetical protein
MYLRFIKSPIFLRKKIKKIERALFRAKVGLDKSCSWAMPPYRSAPGCPLPMAPPAVGAIPLPSLVRGGMRYKGRSPLFGGESSKASPLLPSATSFTNSCMVGWPGGHTNFQCSTVSSRCNSQPKCLTKASYSSGCFSAIADSATCSLPSTRIIANVSNSASKGCSWSNGGNTRGGQLAHSAKVRPGVPGTSLGLG